MQWNPLPQPSELRSLDLAGLQALVEELRQVIISVCLKNGGHIGASLGTVELAVSLHRAFDSPKEPIIWDVGHQAYAHKLLTGRGARFPTLRTTGGISGFLSRAESEHDFFGAGHSSTSLSALLAAGFTRRSDPETAARWSAAVIGDGGLTAGVALEALNNLRAIANPRMLVVLNDNQMSISQNVGSIPSILAEGGARAFFESFGLEYVGPIDGHDLGTLIGCIDGIRLSHPSRPILLHILTQKGKGYLPAEESPASYHGIGPAPQKLPPGAPTGKPKSRTFSEVFGSELCDIAARDARVLAVTAAMPDGTGLVEFSRSHPDRFFDVGIAEAHAVTFSAALAVEGHRPVVAIYSTFLQRGIDGIIHDVAIQGLPVVFAIDRAGVVGADGPTHHGVFDLAILGAVPGLSILCPSTLADMRRALDESLLSAGPTAIRYPRGSGPEDDDVTSVDGLRWHWVASRPRLVVVALGAALERARAAVSSLPPDLIRDTTFVSCTRAKPIPEDLIEALRSNPSVPVLVIEDGAIRGGFGQALLVAAGPRSAAWDLAGYEDRFIPHGSVPDLEALLGVSSPALVERAKRLIAES